MNETKPQKMRYLLVGSWAIFFGVITIPYIFINYFSVLNLLNAILPILSAFIYFDLFRSPNHETRVNRVAFWFTIASIVASLIFSGHSANDYFPRFVVLALNLLSLILLAYF